MKLPQIHEQALRATGTVVEGVADRQLDLPSPCSGWSVRELLNHIVSGNYWAAELGSGFSIEAVGDRLDGDVLGTDPLRAYDDSALVAAAVFRAPGAMEAPCAVSYGPVPGEIYCGHRFLDVFIHGWDLATATGQDTALDPDLMEACRQIIEPQLALFRAAGVLAAELPVPPDATPQTRFLAILGRGR